MKLLYRSCAIVLLAAMLLGLCSCDALTVLKNDSSAPTVSDNSHTVSELDLVSTKTAPSPFIPSYSGSDTLRAAINAEIGKVSALFASEGEEYTAASLSHAKLLSTERGGSIVEKGIEGESFLYLDTDYRYYGISDVTVSRTDSGGALYSFKLREDVFFSDGTNMTADDVIFSMYVMLDGSYEGYSRLSELSIVGLDAYNMNMSSMSEIIYLGKDAQSGGYSASEEQTYRDRLSDAVKIYTDQLVRCVSRQYKSDDELVRYGGKYGSGIADMDELSVAYAMTVLGYAEWEKGADGAYTGAIVCADGREYDCVESFPDGEGMFSALMTKYLTPDMLASELICEVDFGKILLDTFGSSYENFFVVKHQSGTSASSVSGIKKTGMYSFSVEVESYDVSDLYAFTFFVAPLHAIGNRDKYKYTEERFGFLKGDIRELKNRKSNICSGAYVYKGANDGTYRFERNTLYYLGCPYVKKLELLFSARGEDAAADIAQGKYDITVTELDRELVSSVKALNSTGDLDGSELTLTKQSTGVYGYIGLNSSVLKIGDDSQSDPSRALRGAFCVLFSHFAPESVYEYFGESAEMTGYPADPRSTLYPSEDGLRYSNTVMGESIFVQGMSEKEKEKALSDAVLEYFVAAGYTYDKKAKKITAAPDGGTLEFEFLLCTDEVGGSPVLPAVQNSSELLDKLGIKLNCRIVSDAEQLTAELCGGGVMMWASAYTLSPKPDLYTHYYSKNTPQHALDIGKNYFGIKDKALDAIILQLAQTSEPEQRSRLYLDFIRILSLYYTELPLYVEQSAFLCTYRRLAKDCELGGLTAYYSWTDTVHTIKLN